MLIESQQFLCHLSPAKIFLRKGPATITDVRGQFRLLNQFADMPGNGFGRVLFQYAAVLAIREKATDIGAGQNDWPAAGEEKR